MADQLQDIVQRMVAAGESEDNIALVIKSYKPQQAAAPEQPKGNLGRFGGVKMIGDAVIGTGKAAINNPVKSLGILGSILGAGATAPVSVPAGLAAVAGAGLGAAGGAALGSMRNALVGGDNGPKTAGGVLKTMASEGAMGAAGEGIGRGVATALKAGGKLIYRTALRPSMALQRDFGDVAATGLREGAAVSEGGAKQTTEKLAGVGERVRGLLAAKDAERPVVRGYLPEARSGELGRAPIHPTMPELRDPRSAGVLLREGTGSTEPWDGMSAAGNMIAPREIAERGLGRVRSEVSDRALAGDALTDVGSLEQRFLAQRNRPLTLQEAQRLKQAEQALADSAYRAEQMGNPVNGVEPQFHRGIARGAREAIEQRVPEVGPLNKQAQELIGLKLALEDATRRNVPGVGSVRTMVGDYMPSVASRGGIAADRTGQALGKYRFNDALKTALIAALGGGSD